MQVITFKTIEIQNFFRIKGPVKQNLQISGLVLIHGKNLDNPAYDSNGAGKSTIFGALVYCLWGKTIRGLRYDEVVNPDEGKDCYVRLTLMCGPSEYEITRYRKHTKHKNKIVIKQDGKDISEGSPTEPQNQIDTLLGIDMDTYIRGPMLGQGSFKRFSEMTDGEQKKILETALGIDMLLKAKKIADSKISDLKQELYLLNEQLAETENQIETGKAELVTLRHSQSTLKQGRLKSLYGFYRTILKEKDKLQEFQDKLYPEIDLTRLQEAFEKAKTLYADTLEHWNKEEKKYMQWIQRIEQDVYAINSDRKRLKTEKHKLSMLADKQCPTCLQPVGPKHLKGCRESVDAKINAQDQVLFTKNSELMDIRHNYSLFSTKKDNAIKQADTLLTLSQEALEDAKSKNGELELIQNTIDLIEHGINENYGEYLEQKSRLSSEGDYGELITQKTKQINTQKQNKNKIQKDAQKTKQKINYYTYWSAGFSNSGIKSKILESVVPYMNRSARYYSRFLTNGETELRFQTQMRGKDGVLREQFGITLLNPTGSGKYVGSSGGERSRIDLAVNFVMSDLVASRSHKSYPQRFFDEPFDALDESGIEAVIELLNDMVKTCGTIFVITHRPDFKQFFNKKIYVTKQNGVTQIHGQEA